MRSCQIGGITVDCVDVTVDAHSFGKPISHEYARPYLFELEAADASACFSSYYLDFIERESEDEGFEEPLDGLYLQIRETGCLSFERMLTDHPRLLSDVLLKLLPVEFMGYLFAAENGGDRYVLQALSELRVDRDRIICRGEAFEIDARK